MPRSLALYFDDLLKASDSIFRFTAGMDRTAYEDNDLVQAAVERCFSIIGEALAQMRRHYPAAMQQIEDSKKIIAFRTVLMHMYSTVDNDDVWSAIQSKLPAFRRQVIALIDDIGPAE
ncbi:MAG: DUF86 domain-containing protein [Acidobacteria bacterium]|nr:DUF86 domain-containing protein [Acidobacteriota bacterium]